MSFQLGDLILKEITSATKEANCGKLGSTLEGPYKVVKIARQGTYWLEDMDEKNFLTHGMPST